NVLIGQKDENKSHSHSFTTSTTTKTLKGSTVNNLSDWWRRLGDKTTGIFSVEKSTSDDWTGMAYATNQLTQLNIDATHNHGGTTDSTGITENRTMNLTTKLWKRIS
ncbi:MAG: hypothetical protein MJZ37_11180, partial [Bacilli bacterium]|nr:hypothetical protein [Bacilli bacterium]